MSSDALAVFNPEVMSGAFKMAQQLAQSSLIPKALYGKPGDVLVVLLTGREFGLGPMMAMRGIHVVDGKPVMAADLMVGLCLGRREVCESFSLVESTAHKATYKTQRVGHAAVELSWTMEQAKAAGVAGKDNWRKYPDAMLRARCASALARAVYPDILAGTYDPDELDVSGPPANAGRPHPIGQTRPVSVESHAVPAAPALPADTGRSQSIEASADTVPVEVPAVPVVSEEMGMEADAICAEAEALEGFDNAGYANLAKRAEQMPKRTEERKRVVAALTAAKKKMDAHRAVALAEAKSALGNATSEEPGSGG